jgi:hypothetical protein
VRENASVLLVRGKALEEPVNEGGGLLEDAKIDSTVDISALTKSATRSLASVVLSRK